MSNEPHAQNSVNIDQLWQELQKSAKLLNMDAHVETPGWVLPEIKIPLLPPKSAYFCEELLVLMARILLLHAIRPFCVESQMKAACKHT